MKTMRLTFKRNDVCLLIDAIDSLEEEYQYNGGTSLIEDELRIRDYLTDRLHRFDGSHQYRAKQAATNNGEDEATREGSVI